MTQNEFSTFEVQSTAADNLTERQ